MKNHKLESTLGEPVAKEIEYPRMMCNPRTRNVILFSELGKGVFVHVGSGGYKIGVPIEINDQAPQYELYNGPVTITGKEIND